MSGGGIRSASFNIGVLAALHETERLRRVDVLSAVSGGAYALSWYYAQHFHDATDRNELDKELFAFGGRFQTSLADNARVFGSAEYWSLGAVNLAMTPVNFLFNGIFGWHMNTTPGRAIYEDRLKAIFQTPPAAKLDSTPIPFAQLKRKVREKQLPYFIINTAAFIEDSSEYLGAPLYNRIYEFTPIFFGSDSLGRHNYDAKDPEFPLTFARAVSISGAALDGTKMISGSSQRTLWSLLNQDLGYYMRNPSLSRDVEALHRILPFPLYYFHHYPRHLDGTDIYLSDGGHAENLGAYALVRRLCAEILVVDAEHDPTYEFEAYHVLKRALRRDMNVELRVKYVDGIAQDERTLREARVDQALRDQGDPDTAARTDEDRRKERLPPLRTMDALEGWRWRCAAEHPATRGRIAHLPYKGRDSELTVDYIKAAYWRKPEECKPADDYFTRCLKVSSEDQCWTALEHRQECKAAAAKCRLQKGSHDQKCKALAQNCTSEEDEAWIRHPQADGNQRTLDYAGIYFCRTRETEALRRSRYTRLNHFPSRRRPIRISTRGSSRPTASSATTSRSAH